jgi:hypothetical protein
MLSVFGSTSITTSSFICEYFRNALSFKVGAHHTPVLFPEEFTAAIKAFAGD